jgi:predicted Fe-Mo cluster-binding NifX family protein/NAD-dependent dihydropyrimidine dehydrogenase PreA subunit
MKIAVTAKGKALDDQVDPRFGRCPYFLVVDTDTMDFEAIENSNAALGGGAGIQSGQLMAEHDVKCVLTGNCGPNAFQTLGAADIQVIVGVSGIVRQAVEQFKSGALSSTSDPNVASHFGMGAGDAGAANESSVQQSQVTGGMAMGKGIRSADSGQVGGGMGQGMGGGRGMGRGGGMGRGMGRGMGMGGGVTPQMALPGLVAVVDVEKCNACKLCQDVCPTGAITLNESAQIDTAKCNGCSRCVAECPQSAISLHKAA